MGTMAKAFIEQGMERGLERGKIEGLAEGLERGKIEGLTEGLERGKIEGLTEGLERGKAEVLMRLMERRFGPLSRTVRDRIAVAGPDELDAWFDQDSGCRQPRSDVRRDRASTEPAQDGPRLNREYRKSRAVKAARCIRFLPASVEHGSNSGLGQGHDGEAIKDIGARVR